MNNCVGNNYSARLRSRSKQPIYTSDKRAKFTQRENKKWIRFVTVLGYIFFVSLPAVSLSIYYIYIWDPGYIKKFPAEINANKSIPIHKTPIISARTPRESSVLPISVATTSPMKHDQKTCSCQQQETTKIPTDQQATLDLVTILEEGTKSMESSASFENDRTNQT